MFPHSGICDWHRLEFIQLEFKARHRAPNFRHVCPVDSAQRHGSLKKRGVGTSTPDLLQCQLLGRIGQGLATAGRTGKVTGRPPPTAVRPGVGSDATPVEDEPAEGGSQEHPSPPKFGKSPGPLSYPPRVPSCAEIGGAWDERADAGTAVHAGRWAHPALQRWVAGSGGLQREGAYRSLEVRSLCSEAGSSTTSSTCSSEGRSCCAWPGFHLCSATCVYAGWCIASSGLANVGKEAGPPES